MYQKLKYIEKKTTHIQELCFVNKNVSSRIVVIEVH